MTIWRFFDLTRLSFSYEETIDFLYNTSTFQIDNLSFLTCRTALSSKPVSSTSYKTSHAKLLHFPPKVATSITSLNLVSWLLTSVQLDRPTMSPNQRHWNEYTFIMNVLPDVFPHLQHLNISVKPNDFFAILKPYEAETVIEVHENHVLGPIDVVARRYGPKLEEMNVATPFTYFAQLKPRVMGRGTKIEIVHHPTEGRPFQRYWRSAEGGTEEDPKAKVGYWVREGVDDTVLPVSNSPEFVCVKKNLSR